MRDALLVCAFVLLLAGCTQAPRAPSDFPCVEMTQWQQTGLQQAMATASTPKGYRYEEDPPQNGETGTDPALLQQWGAYKTWFVTWQPPGDPDPSSHFWSTKLDVDSRTLHFSIPDGIDPAKARQDAASFAAHVLDVTAPRAQQLVDQATSDGRRTDARTSLPVTGEAFLAKVDEPLRLSALTQDLAKASAPTLKTFLGSATVTWENWTFEVTVPLSTVVHDDGISATMLRAGAAGSVEFSQGASTYVRQAVYTTKMQSMFTDLGLDGPPLAARAPSAYTGRTGFDCGPVAAK